MADKIRYDGFAGGMNNRLDDFDFGDLTSLRNAVNVDILTSGKPRMRAGLVQRIADAGAHSVFSDGQRIVWATATALKIAGPNLVARTLLTDVRLADPLSWLELHGELYFSNERINGKVNASDAYELWGITPPEEPPSLVALAGDRYVMVTCAFVLTSGEVSGAPVGAKVACTDTPSILVSNIPQSDDARVVATRLYVTDLNGRDFYAHADVPAGVTSYVVAGELCVGEQLKTQFMQPPPLGQLLTFCRGRIYIASGSNIFRTQPLRYGAYDPEEDFFMEPERVRLLKGCDDGLYLSSDRTYFLPDPGAAQRQRIPVLPYRAIEGAACDLPDSKDVMWFSERGFVRGSPGGVVKNLTEGQVDVESVERACMGVIGYRGHEAVVAIARDGTEGLEVSPDFTAAEAERIDALE